MEELKLNPSGEVWKNVEVQISKEKKHRWLLLFFLFLFVFCGGMFWWKEYHQIRNDLVKQNTVASIDTRKEAVAAITKPDNIDAIKKQTIITDSVYDKKEIVFTGKTSARLRSTQHIADAFENAWNRRTVNIKSKVKAIVTENDPSVADVVEEKPLNDSASITSAVKDSSISNFNKKLIVVTDSSKKTEIKITKDTSKTKQKSKWDFAVQLGLGISATGHNYLSNINSTAVATTTTGVITNGIRPYSLSSVKMSWAFKVGLSAMYHISKRVTVTAGLTYKLYSTVIATGAKFIDSNNTGANVYFSGTNNSYHNYYHFIDVPVEFQYQIGNNAQLPVYAFAGINLSNLIYTNALQFNYANGTYYQDNSLFYKPTIGLSGGLLFDMFIKKKMPLQIGPDLYYSFSNMARSGLYTDKHYSYLGLRFQHIIGKK
jgi:hypothetical protein